MSTLKDLSTKFMDFLLSEKFFEPFTDKLIEHLEKKLPKAIQSQIDAAAAEKLNTMNLPGIIEYDNDHHPYVMNNGRRIHICPICLKKNERIALHGIEERRCIACNQQIYISPTLKAKQSAMIKEINERHGSFCE